MPTSPFGYRVRKAFPARQVARYVIVGGVNTVVGLGTSALVLFLLNHALPADLHGIRMTQPRLTVAASIVTTPLNITVAYLNYKLFVFRTRGRWLQEWARAFGVYGVSNIIGWLALGVVTKLIEWMLHGRAPLGKGTPGYIAMVAMTSITTAVSYIGHRKVTFGGSPGHDEDIAAEEASSV